MFSDKLSLEFAILATISYFDIFDYPLTLLELWKWLYRPSLREVGLSGIREILTVNFLLQQHVTSFHGFYFLKGREEIIERRVRRYLIAQKKFKKALRVAKLFSFIPWVKMIAVSNNLAYSNASYKSDIDFFIITAQDRLWTTRFYALTLLEFLGLRPTQEKTQDKICLNCFVSQDNLNLEKVAQEPFDICFIYWISQFLPIYDSEKMYQKFIQANQWTRKYLPNSFAFEPNPRREINKSKIVTLLHCHLVKLLNFPLLKFGLNLAERFYKQLQLKIMPPLLKKMANQDTRVIITDKMLKFHSNDRREYYREIFLDKVKEFRETLHSKE